MKVLFRFVTTLGLVVLLSGCALTPDYERPEMDPPQSWQEDVSAEGSVANLPWWDLYQDPQLKELIQFALEENKDLAVALARIEESRSSLTITRADQFPFLGVLGGGGRGSQSEIMVPGAGTSDIFNVSADLSFEIDLWRQYARATEAARADLLATEEAYRNITISLVANVATTYFLMRDMDERLNVSRQTVEGRTRSLEIIQARYDKGVVAELDVNQAQIELAIADVAVATFERLSIQAENALQILLGRQPGNVTRGLTLEEQGAFPEVPAGLPSELLRRRPDLVVAEQRLVAEMARVGVAEALRWPSISITGSFGAISDEFSDLNTSDAKAWNVAGGIFAPIFNSGALKAQAEAQRARAEQELYRYQNAYLNALREVEDALVAVRTYRREYEARQRQVIAARNAAKLSRARYDGGVVDYLEVLDSERSLFTAELDSSATLKLSLSATVELYKALGGGWTETDEREKP